jgi:nucleotide-binding universal stress UspA family protein
VWIADADQKYRCDRILAAIDPSTDDSAKLKLNVDALSLAAELATSTGASLYVINAWLPLGESLFRTHLPEASLRKYIADARRYAHMEMANLLARCNTRIPPSNVHVIRGDRHEVIAGFAAQRHIDLIVMGNVGRTGISGLVIGNTAEQVLRQAQCSVLTIRPDALVVPARTDHRRRSRVPESYSAAMSA